MSEINQQLFARGPSFRVRHVNLQSSDPVHRHREKLAKIVFDAMFQFVGLLDAEGTVLEINQTALDAVGLEIDDVRGKPFWETRWWQVSPMVQEQLKVAIQKARNGEFVRFDVENYGDSSGADKVVLDTSITPIKDENGQVVFLLPEGKNITEKKRAEAEVALKNEETKKLLARIRELDQLKTEFFANVSHELRTPLALILGPTEKILSDAANLTDGQRQELETVRRNASTLLKQVNSLLDISKLAAGKMTLNYEPCDLTQVVRLAAGHFDALAPQRDITFVIQSVSSLPAQLDREKVERILLNLLSNAFKFAPDGGRVEICLFPLGKDQARLTVQDNGPGVPEADRGRIFERFAQADGGMSREFGGTGLGLAIAKEFVELHHGTIAVKSAMGGGALFEVVLPVTAPAYAKVHDVTHAQTETPASRRFAQGVVDELVDETEESAELVGPEGKPIVLVVEDNPEMSRFIRAVVSSVYQVTTARNGHEGLARLKGLKPDLIITDIMTPGLSGDQMVEVIRRDVAFDNIPIIVLSAKADDALRLRLLNGGVQDYLVKPFSPDELQARVRNWVKVKRARDLLQSQVESQNSDLDYLAQEVTDKNKLLQRNNDEIREWTYAASHDLKEPLRVISVYTELLSRDYRATLGENGVKCVDYLSSSVKTLLSLIDGVLAHSEVESGPSHRQPTDLNRVAREAASNVSRRVQEMGADISVSPLPVVNADGELLTRLFQNLFENALKFVAPGRRPSIHVSASSEGDDWHVWVRDNGIGISPDNTDRIFGMFKRVYSREDYPGNGIGLTLCKKIVERHRGRIWATSALGEGTTFHFTLPRT